MVYTCEKNGAMCNRKGELMNLYRVSLPNVILKKDTFEFIDLDETNTVGYIDMVFRGQTYTLGLNNRATIGRLNLLFYCVKFATHFNLWCTCYENSVSKEISFQLITFDCLETIVKIPSSNKEEKKVVSTENVVVPF